MSSGSTFLRESGSYVLASCAFTKLKNHKCPIHITPAARCVQRKMTFSHSFMESPGWSETTARTLPSADRSVERRATSGRLRFPMPAALGRRCAGGRTADSPLHCRPPRGIGLCSAGPGACRAWYPLAAMDLRELVDLRRDAATICADLAPIELAFAPGTPFPLT